ncbi:TIGR04104 family putative zinc finger protein [Lentibacillus sp. CBA3610]|uniref:TIGR04104 family putative zinc finger protein n=1 Tax=Lentibacillus sp. CBA3610 TaxID=2518176 RepID=UPI00159564DA|nr:TIGR04104 family putative zinc finger protein [Lentibacillus sp. CBA3610]QKY71267.1 hypothetical protein Len3610_18455 [Lentibacillus sp. CBA3610]
MPICENCHNKWSWKQTIKKTFPLDPRMTCPYCGETQYQIQKSKTKGGFLIGTVFFLLLLIQNFFDISVAGSLSLLPVMLIIIFLLYPFLVELNSREEGIFN